MAAIFSQLFAQAVVALAAAQHLPADIPMACATGAATRHQVPLSVLFALRAAEGGQVGLVRHNTNGSVDHAQFQINDRAWLSTLQRDWGIAPELAHNPCAAPYLAAYIVGRERARCGDLWCAVGNYHSRTPAQHWRYRNQVGVLAQRYEQLFTQAAAWANAQTTLY